MRGMNVSSKGAGLPLIVVGVVASSYAAAHLQAAPVSVNTVSPSPSTTPVSPGPPSIASSTSQALSTGAPPATSAGRSPTPPPPPPPVVPVETTITLSRSSGPAGTVLQVSGVGFPAGRTVVLSFHTDEVGRTTTDSGGAFTGVSITVPNSYGQFAPAQFFVGANTVVCCLHAQAPFNITR
jgi:hypothetical protein